MSKRASIKLDLAQRHIELLSCHWPINFSNAVMEIRCINADRIISLKFNPCDSDELARVLSSASKHNSEGFEIYCTVNPGTPGINGSISDTHILGSKFHFADADTQQSFDSLNSTAPQADFIVTTGTIPFKRAHFYWELTEPSHDLGKWPYLQRQIAIAHGADTTISNPSRIMRLAGFNTNPSEQKIARGYTSELVLLVELQND